MLQIAVYKQSGTVNTRTVIVELRCLAGNSAADWPGVSLGSTSTSINVPNGAGYFSITVSSLPDLAGYSTCESRCRRERSRCLVA